MTTQRSIDSVSITNYRTTGSNVSVPQIAIDVTVNWADPAGAPHSDTRTINFPNVLNLLNAQQQKALVIDVVYRALRVYLNIEAGE